MIGVIDYGAGNLRSVYKALETVGSDCRIIGGHDDLGSFDGIVLPGVGAFSKTMSSLRQMNITEPLKKYIELGRPFLGICLGLQILFEESEEIFDTEEKRRIQGLGIIKGRVKRFPEGMKVPQIGWNSIDITDAANPLFKGIRNETYFYFVHSYYVDPKEENAIACYTDYGIRFASGIAKDNIYAVQFHPEKSSRLGLALLENFSNMVSTKSYRGGFADAG